MRHIPKLLEARKGIIATARHVAVVMAIPALLTSCWGANLTAGLERPDTKIVTGAVQPQYKAPADSTSDEITVRNAVSSADLSSPESQTIPWANTSTGSAGVISAIAEESNGSYVCRTFMTTRHSYKGISNFVGKACLVGSGEWQLMSFKEIG